MPTRAASSRSPTTSSAQPQALLEHLVDDDRELVTVITGADATDDATSELEAWFESRFGTVELEVHQGGQPLYPFLFGVE